MDKEQYAYVVSAAQDPCWQRRRLRKQRKASGAQKHHKHHKHQKAAKQQHAYFHQSSTDPAAARTARYINPARFPLQSPPNRPTLAYSERTHIHPARTHVMHTTSNKTPHQSPEMQLQENAEADANARRKKKLSIQEKQALCFGTPGEV